MKNLKLTLLIVSILGFNKIGYTQNLIETKIPYSFYKTKDDAINLTNSIYLSMAKSRDFYGLYYLAVQDLRSDDLLPTQNVILYIQIDKDTSSNTHSFYYTVWKSCYEG